MWRGSLLIPCIDLVKELIELNKNFKMAERLFDFYIITAMPSGEFPWNILFFIHIRPFWIEATPKSNWYFLGQ